MGRSARRVGEGADAHHGEDPRSGVPELEVLVRELGAVDGLAAGAVAAGEVTSLAHEVGDDAVEGGPLVGERLARASHPFLARAQRAEVLARPGHHVRAELERDASDGRAADAHVEVTSRQRRHRVRRADFATPRARICVVADDGISRLAVRAQTRRRSRRATAVWFHRNHRSSILFRRFVPVSNAKFWFQLPFKKLG